MNAATLAHALTIGTVLFTCGIIAALPRLSRRGLLFGAYVGEERGGSDAARGIARSFSRGVLLAAGLGIATDLLAARVLPPGAWMAAALAVASITIVAAYVSAWRRASALAPPAAAPARPAAPPQPEEPGALVLPLLTLALCALLGGAALVEGVLAYHVLPARMPVHFGPSGTPDRWAAKGLASGLGMPFISFIMGLVLGGAAVLTAGARRSIREGDGRSARARRDFRRAVTIFLCVIAVLVTLLTAGIAHGALQVALGRSAGLSPWMMVIGIALAACAVGGSIWLAVAHGQGGAFREGESAGSPLEGGLADNAHWKWGMFYVNPHDPALMVEKRFGLGYTLNFGNRMAIVITLGFILGMAVIAVIAIASTRG